MTMASPISVDLNGIVQTTLSKSKDLAQTLFRNYASQAQSDVQTFLQTAKDGIQRATDLYLQKKIDKDDLEDLILGKKDLAEMHALKQVGLAKAAIDTFVNGVLQILVDAVFSAVKIP
jgi:uncharacterized protein YjbJ (UPF0337 family)